MRIAAIMQNPEALFDKQITVAGWIRTLRSKGMFLFIELNDGSCFKGLQVIYTDTSIITQIDRCG
jgi:asparaginyl-tRNA synthetase